MPTNHRTILTAALAGAVTLSLGVGVTPAQAGAGGGARSAPEASITLARQSYTDVIATLEGNGYRVVKMSSTMLGRVKIVARNSQHLREIVVSRSTGEIKHDVILKVYRVKDGADAARRTKSRLPGVSLGSGGGSSGGGSGGSVSVDVGGGGASASVGGSGGASASVGGGGASVSVGGGGLSIGN